MPALHRVCLPGCLGARATTCAVFIPWHHDVPCHRAQTDHEGLYDVADLEKDWESLPAGFTMTGGVFLEAISCCFKEKSAQELAPLCIQEAEWVAAELSKSSKGR